jgi:hypothetical protein
LLYKALTLNLITINYFDCEPVNEQLEEIYKLYNEPCLMKRLQAVEIRRHSNLLFSYIGDNYRAKPSKELFQMDLKTTHLNLKKQLTY